MRRCIAEGLVGGERFAVDASLIAADANMQRSTAREDWDPAAIDPDTAPRAVREYLAVLDDAAFGAASPVEPKFTSPADPAAQWTGARRATASSPMRPTTWSTPTTRSSSTSRRRAVHRSFVTYVAAAARVQVEADGTVRVPQIDIAIDCGFPANPERIRSQLERAAVMGMTLALHSAITFEEGAVVQSNFHDYEMVRSDNFPQTVRVHIVEHPFSVHASGVGEPGVPPIAPAIANGIFRATGKRLRDLPFGPTV